MFDYEKLAKLLSLASSDNDAEALSAVRTATQIVKKAGRTWEDILRVKPSVKANLEDATFPFGKYKGERVSDVHQENPSYLDWCLDQEWLKPEMRKVIQEVMRG